jgi:hypothetical protein
MKASTIFAGLSLFAAAHGTFAAVTHYQGYRFEVYLTSGSWWGGRFTEVSDQGRPTVRVRRATTTRLSSTTLFPYGSVWRSRWTD